MNKAYEQLLTSLLKIYHLQYALLATSAGTILATAGSATTLPTSDLVRSLCGDQAVIQRLDQSLEGQLLPRSWGQGETIAHICKPSVHQLAILFGTKTSLQHDYELSQHLDQALQQLFTTHS